MNAMKQSDAMGIRCLLLIWNIRWKLNYPTKGKCPKMVIRTVESLSNTQTLSLLFDAHKQEHICSRWKAFDHRCVYTQEPNPSKYTSARQRLFLLRITRNTCKSLQLAFVYAPFFILLFFLVLFFVYHPILSASIAISVHSCYAHTQSHTEMQSNRCSHFEASERCVYAFFCVSVLNTRLALGDYISFCTIPVCTTTTSIRCENHLSKVRSLHAYTGTRARCRSFALSWPLCEEHSFPVASRVCVIRESIRRIGNIFLYNNTYMLRRALSFGSFARSLVVTTTRGERANHFNTKQFQT